MYYYYNYLIELQMGFLPYGSSATIGHNTEIHVSLFLQQAV
jgi:hypothetical protein